MVKSLIPIEQVERRIFLIRGHKVMLDRDLATLYGVPTKALNQAVKRNGERFPPEFMFRLKRYERDEVVTNCDHLRTLKFSRQMPLVFTEHGVAMLSSVLNSTQAIQVNIQIIKAFVRLREMTSTHKELAGKLVELERKIKNHDIHIRDIFGAIKQLMEPPKKTKPRIGFRPS
jgi:hypothetical protein